MNTRGGHLLPIAALLVAISCGYYQAEAVDQDNPVDPGDPSTPAGSDIPCDVASVLSTYCLSCHSDPPKAGAPMSLVSRDDLLASSAVVPGTLVGERVAARMQDASRPMPPSGMPAPSEGEVAIVAAWVAEGMPAELCESGPGQEPTGPQPTTCSTGEKWPADWEDFDAFEDGSPDMNPGLPCRGCHIEENDDMAMFFMGTVFPTLHEEDRCYSDVPDGTIVEIIDKNGLVALELAVRQSGNFFSNSKSAGIDLPFTARVVRPDGSVMQMTTPQMTGDCNACHTEQGENGAPGRILLPTL